MPRPRNKTSDRRPSAVRRAFTLAEMMVVIAIIAVLATLIVPRMLGQLDKAKTSAAKKGCTAIANAVQAFVLDSDRTTPSPDLDLEILLLPPDDGGGPHGPYINKADDLLDPWGNAYVLLVPGEVNYDFDVVSYGADGQSGGDGENADITQ